ncbi:MAG TPA: YrdB family protein [Anaerolineales bacterium]|nr:YrdB family protein [Anaerolineales bacterium]
MSALKMLNLGVRFLLELCMLAAVGYWGFKTQTGMMKIVLGIGLPVLLIVIWSLFVAPRAVYPLHGVSHMLLSLILLGSGAVALFASGRTALGWAYAIILVVNQILLIVWKQ